MCFLTMLSDPMVVRERRRRRRFGLVCSAQSKGDGPVHVHSTALGSGGGAGLLAECGTCSGQRVLHEIALALDVPMHLLTLLASRPEDLNDKADPKQVSELAGALLRLLVRVGEQGTLPLDGQEEKKIRRKKSA